MASSGSLAGRRVVVTQASHQAPALCQLLADRGSIPIAYPCIAIEPPEDTTELDDALAQAARGYFDWIVFTSANTVMIVAQRLAILGLEHTAISSASLAAIGEPTAAAVQEQLGSTVDLIPDESVAEGLAASLLTRLEPGQRVLLPQANIARPVLYEALTAGGAHVTAVAAYRTTIGRGGAHLPELLANGQVDGLLLTSSSTARNLLERLQSEGGHAGQLDQVTIACIGQITAKTAAEVNLPVAVVAATQSLEGLVEALATYWTKTK